MEPVRTSSHLRCGAGMRMPLPANTRDQSASLTMLSPSDDSCMFQMRNRETLLRSERLYLPQVIMIDFTARQVGHHLGDAQLAEGCSADMLTCGTHCKIYGLVWNRTLIYILHCNAGSKVSWNVFISFSSNYSVFSYFNLAHAWVLCSHVTIFSYGYFYNEYQI